MLSYILILGFGYDHLILYTDLSSAFDFSFAVLASSYPENCGKPVISPDIPDLSADERIIHGTEAVPHSFPWQVSIMDELDGHYCGASILSPNWVLTAAHCAKIIWIGVLYSDEVALGQHNR